MQYELPELEQMLSESLADHKLSRQEKSQFKTVTTGLNAEQRRFMNNRAFDLVRAELRTAGSATPIELSFSLLRWLEQTQKALNGAVDCADPNVHFSPGETCRRAILDAVLAARASIDICVFTISDDRISKAILKAHQRGVKVRIITDNDKSDDMGSDVDWLREQGVAVCMDSSPSHMHHKFALIDAKQLINGSFNWTRSATDRNQENIMLSYHPKAIDAFSTMFETLWRQYT